MDFAGYRDRRFANRPPPAARPVNRQTALARHAAACPRSARHPAPGLRQSDCCRDLLIDAHQLGCPLKPRRTDLALRSLRPFVRRARLCRCGPPIYPAGCFRAGLRIVPAGLYPGLGCNPDFDRSARSHGKSVLRFARGYRFLTLFTLPSSSETRGPASVGVHSSGDPSQPQTAPPVFNDGLAP